MREYIFDDHVRSGFVSRLIKNKYSLIWAALADIEEQLTNIKINMYLEKDPKLIEWYKNSQAKLLQEKEQLEKELQI